MELKLSSENFEKEVLNSEKPVLVDFYADWCGPCNAMAPIVEELATELNEKAKVGKINVDENSDIAVKYNVTSKVSPKDNEPITLVNLKEFDNDTGEFLGSRLSEASGIVPGQINLSGEVAKELPPIVVGSKLQEKNEVVSGISKGLID